MTIPQVQSMFIFVFSFKVKRTKIFQITTNLLCGLVVFESPFFE